MKRRNTRGFTLVELLIVIALIAILSVAVLATINPIEQANKARDAKFKNDAAEVLSAYERYYASMNSYPWNNVGETIAPGIAVAIGSTAVEFGVLDAAGDADGELIVTSELKSSFGNKEFFRDDMDPLNAMYLYHNGSDSNYVCFFPKAKANRTLTEKLACLDAVGVGATFGLVNLGACTTQAADANPYNTELGAVANMMCVPE